MKYDQDSIVAVISRADWFDDIPDDAIRLLASKSLVKTYAPDQFIYLVGERPKHIYCVLSGRVRVSVTSSMGQEFVLTDMHAESWLGEASLIGGKTRVLEAAVIEETDILLIPADVVMRVADQYPILYKNLFVEHMERTRQVYELLAGMLFYPLKSRLAGRLLDLAKKHGEPSSDGVELDMHMSQLDFARMSLGSRQRVNKIFRDWVKQDILLKQGDKYVIKDVEALRNATRPEEQE
ncbi:MAG: Crp/Fnr family transcriptional regulator [Pseudomonadota bacterium]